MKILIYPHDLEPGGSQLNAIELAAAVRDRGHDVTVFGVPGSLCRLIEDLRLPFVPAPAPGRRPSPAITSSLRAYVRANEVDVVHAYEWPPSLEARLACLGNPGAVAVSTVMSMAVAPFLPRHMPLLVGTHQIAAVERIRGRELVGVMQPPVDLVANSLREDMNLELFRRQYGIAADKVTVVCVSRLAEQLKLEGLLTAIDLFGTLDQAQLVIAGDGPARRQVLGRVASANKRAGRRAVLWLGHLRDPRPAYAVADIVLGMGGSALRGLAFQKPLVVQGENGFWLRLDETTLSQFQWRGWYGAGPGVEQGSGALAEAVSPLIRDPALRSKLGIFGRHVVETDHSLLVAASQLEDWYASAQSQPPLAPGRWVKDAIHSTAKLASYTLSSTVRQVLGTAARDDFNASPVAAAGPPIPPGFTWGPRLAGSDRPMSAASRDVQVRTSMSAEAHSVRSRQPSPLPRDHVARSNPTGTSPRRTLYRPRSARASLKLALRRNRGNPFARSENSAPITRAISHECVPTVAVAEEEH